MADVNKSRLNTKMPRLTAFRSGLSKQWEVANDISSYEIGNTALLDRVMTIF